VAAIFQRVAEALELALDDDALVWYEPLYDPSGEKPHFVVLEPRRGIIVLEVVDVDRASFLGVLRGAMRVMRDGREVEIENPLRRATALVEVLRARLAADERLASLDIPVGAVAVFPRLGEEEARERGLEHAIRLDHALFGGDVRAALAEEGSARILRVLARVLGGALEGLPADAETRLRLVVQPDIEIPRGEQLSLFRAPAVDRAERVRALDRRQEAISKGLGSGHRVLRGVAGSGKTLMLVYRAKLLARAWPRAPILLTCYTRSLASHLRGLLAPWPNVEVTHLDRVMQRVIAAAGLRHPGFEGDESGEEVARLARRALAGGAGPRYHAVLLDEGQDFGIEALRFVTELLAEGHHDLVIAMDSAQNIFRRKFSFKQAGIQAAGRTRVLKRNYRNTGEIGAFAYRFLSPARGRAGDEEAAILEPELDAHGGERPRVILCDRIEDEVAAVVETVRQWREGEEAGPRSIAVLYTRPDRSLARALFRALADQPVFWVNDPDHPANRDLIGQAGQAVVLSTVYSAKGFEYPRVVLVGLFDPKQGPEESRKLAYVGMTRATDQLVVVAGRREPLARDLPG
jgi:hypothetical protein